jgi:flagellar hook assembly protein FlgD
MVRTKLFLGLAAAAMIAAPMAAPALAQVVSRITFAKGNDNASVKGTIKGKAYRDYKLGVGNGQNLGVSLTGSSSVNFNILPPGSSGEAVYNSSSQGTDATGIRTVKGDYTIRVYLMGAAETSGKAYPYQLSVAVVNF